MITPLGREPQAVLLGCAMPGAVGTRSACTEVVVVMLTAIPLIAVFCVEPPVTGEPIGVGTVVPFAPAA